MNTNGTSVKPGPLMVATMVALVTAIKSVTRRYTGEAFPSSSAEPLGGVRESSNFPSTIPLTAR